MARVLTNVRMFAGGADLTGQQNKVEIQGAEYEEKDSTTFGSDGWKEVLGSLPQGKLSGGGHWQATDLSYVDNQAWASLGAQDAYSVFEHGADVASVAYLTKAVETKYAFLGSVGDIAPWSLDAPTTWPMVRGKGAHPPGTARTASGNGTAVEHVAVGASQYLYACLHVLSVSGTDTPTLTVKVQSDNGSGFPSAADQITFAAATAIGGQVLRAAGAITDTWYRASWTISGTNPSFLFVVTFGVA